MSYVSLNPPSKTRYEALGQAHEALIRELDAVLDYDDFNAAAALQAKMLPIQRERAAIETIEFGKDGRAHRKCGGPTPPTDPHVAETFAALSGAYRAALAVHADAYPVPPAHRTTFAHEMNWERSLTSVERASIERLERAGSFASVGSLAQVANGADCAVARGAVMFRPGWLALMQAALFGPGSITPSGSRPGSAAGSRPGTPHRPPTPFRPGSATVLSVNWSRTWIRGCMAAVADESARVVPRINIEANEIDVGAPGSGRLDRRWRRENCGLWTGYDKLRALREREGPQRAQPSPPRIVYVGDSPTDLGCLVAADVGICMRGREGRDEPSEARELKRVLDRIGAAACLHISAFQEDPWDERVLRPRNGALVLYWARDFQEIVDSPLFAQQ